MGFAEPKNPEIWIIADQLTKTGAHTVGGHLVEQSFDVRYFQNHDEAWQAKLSPLTRKPAAILCDGEEFEGMSGEEYISRMKMSSWDDVPIAAFSSIDGINKALIQAGADEAFNRAALAKDIDHKFPIDVHSNAAWEHGGEKQRFDAFCEQLNLRHRNPISFA